MINQLTIWQDPELMVHLLLRLQSAANCETIGVLLSWSSENIAHYNLDRQLKISYIVSITWTKGQTHIRSLAETAFPPADRPRIALKVITCPK